VGRRPLRFYGRWLLGALSLPVRLWYFTLRVRVHPDIFKFSAEDGPLLWAFWHEHLFVAGALRRWVGRKHPVCAMVSASRDGEWLAKFLGKFSIGTVRGSSNHGGYDAYRAARETLGGGDDIVITPDGPRGPARRCKGGIVHLALAANRPIIALRLRFFRAISLHSWDGFRIPLPFSRVEITGVRITAEELGTLPPDGRLERVGAALDGRSLDLPAVEGGLPREGGKGGQVEGDGHGDLGP
jgi:lysophospholipid acyltransferase (LPLAT)-like uncharacterized protein